MKEVRSWNLERGREARSPLSLVSFIGSSAEYEHDIEVDKLLSQDVSILVGVLVTH